MGIAYLPPNLLPLPLLCPYSLFNCSSKDSIIFSNIILFFFLLTSEIHQTEAKLLTQLAGKEMKKDEKNKLKNGYDQNVGFLLN